MLFKDKFINYFISCATETLQIQEVIENKKRCIIK